MPELATSDGYRAVRTWLAAGQHLVGLWIVVARLGYAPSMTPCGNCRDRLAWPAADASSAWEGVAFDRWLGGCGHRGWGGASGVSRQLGIAVCARGACRARFRVYLPLMVGF